MASKKKVVPVPPPHRQNALLSYALGPGRMVTVSIVGALAIAASAVWAWSNHSHHLTTDPDYVVTPDRIELIPPPPADLPGDIKLQALRVASLDGSLPLLDRELARRLAQAFALHPWIEKVERVEKRYPAHVFVLVVYRQPSLLVEVRNQAYAVDRHGILLPGDDVKRFDSSKLPRLQGGTNPPAAPSGLPWGDPIVHAAARLARLLSDSAWEKYGMTGIRQVPRTSLLASSEETPESEFEILTKDGLKIVWGHAPGSEVRGEARAEQKLRDMFGYFAKNPSPNPLVETPTLDLRTPILAAPVHSAPEIVGFGTPPK